MNTYHADGFYLTDGFFMRYNYGMRKFNLKPLSYRLWVMIAFTLLFIMWLCVQFVFTQLLGQYFLYFVLPCTVVGLGWDAAIYFYYKHIGAFDENGCLKEEYPRKPWRRKKEQGQ